MQTHQSELPGTTSTRGKSDPSGQPMSIQIGELKKRFSNLLTLHKKLTIAQDALKDAIKASADASGLLASTVAAAVKAMSGDNEAYEAAKLKASQRALVFDELESSRSETKQ